MCRERGAKRPHAFLYRQTRSAPYEGNHLEILLHVSSHRRRGAVQVRHPGRLRRAARAAAQDHARQQRQRHPAAGPRGINGTVSATREGIDGLLAWLRNDPRLVDVDHKESYCDEQPFYRTKVKLKKEIVTLGVPGVDPNQAVGTYVEPKDWNA